LGITVLRFCEVEMESKCFYCFLGFEIMFFFVKKKTIIVIISDTGARSAWRKR